ncbi:MAG: SDR family oxidoreductase [Elusimicrobiales bacterium]|nr:SDR family oxidoreductase [Elusimicrobiales bacterium]
MKIAVSGSSGYVGLRLIPRLVEKGFEIKAGVRDPSYLNTRYFANKINIIQTDFIKSNKNLDYFFEDVDVAYYLIHSMNDSEGFSEIEKICAFNFSRYAIKHHVKKIIYLGALVKEDEKDISPHMESRIMVGKILRENHPCVLEFRAGIIIGSGSTSFEMIRYTIERLPFIPYIENLDSLCQPIGIRDVLSYLILASTKEFKESKVIEIGGPNILKYIDMLKIYSDITSMNRKAIKCPFNNPKYCAMILSYLSPIPYNIAVSLLKSLKNSSVVTNNTSKIFFPEIEPIDYKTQIRYALRRIVGNEVESIWTTSYIPHHIKKYKNLTETQGVIIQSYSIKIKDVKNTFLKIKSIGGNNGYYYANFLWRTRAFIDKLTGGIGMRNGRRHPVDTHPGETIDFWRVEKIIEGKLLLLRAEMKLPGYGWLMFEIKENHLFLTAYFKPNGIFGYLYWYILYPIHHFVFKGMIKKISS